jgi:chemotaxis family two-component system response regulator PixG
MTPENNPFKVSIREFVGTRQASLFQTFKQPQFTGQLILVNSQQQEWTFYLYLGRILYATGGEHPVRRWKRNLLTFAPNLGDKLSSLDEKTKKEIVNQECWEYYLLSSWLEQGLLNRQQLSQIIRSIIVEILFDLTQSIEVTFEIKANQPLSSQLVLVDADQVIVEAWQIWQSWQGAKLADRSPNRAPIIRQPEELSKRTSEKTYGLMTKFFNGKNTLRDLSLLLKQDVAQMTRLMIPFIQLGFIDLMEVPDLSSPVAKLKGSQLNSENQKIVICCITHTVVLSEQLKKIVKELGYNFISFDNPNRAIAALLGQKPDLLFLDLDLPNINGYEFSLQLKKFSSLKNTPFIIMSENVNLMDRVRAKMSGFSEILSKPIEAQTVLSLFNKYLG